MEREISFRKYMRRQAEVGIRASLFDFRGLAAQIPLIVFVGGFVIGKSTNEQFPEKFYEVSAQVIPVVLLVLAFELRFFQYQPGFIRRLVEESEGRMDEAVAAYRRYVAYVVLLGVLTTLILGEMISIFCLAFEHSGGRMGQGVVLGSLMAGFALIGFAAVVGVRRRSREAEKKDQEKVS